MGAVVLVGDCCVGVLWMAGWGRLDTGGEQRAAVARGTVRCGIAVELWVGSWGVWFLGARSVWRLGGCRGGFMQSF